MCRIFARISRAFVEPCEWGQVPGANSSSPRKSQWEGNAIFDMYAPYGATIAVQWPHVMFIQLCLRGRNKSSPIIESLVKRESPRPPFTTELTGPKTHKMQETFCQAICTYGIKTTSPGNIIFQFQCQVNQICGRPNVWRTAAAWTSAGTLRTMVSLWDFITLRLDWIGGAKTNVSGETTANIDTYFMHTLNAR